MDDDDAVGGAISSCAIDGLAILWFVECYIPFSIYFTYEECIFEYF